MSLVSRLKNFINILSLTSYRVNESESSEDELYSKKEPPRSVKKEAVPLLELNHPVRNPTSNQTLAEWAVDNMCYNPGIFIFWKFLIIVFITNHAQHLKKVLTKKQYLMSQH